MVFSIKKENLGKIAVVLGSFLLAGAIIFVGIVANKELQPIEGVVAYERQTEIIQFDVPTNGATAIGTLKHGVKAVYGGNEARPTASMAKTITALVVLNEKPLPNDEVFTISARDVERYSREVVRSGSRLHVVEGEQLTQRQAIEALMLVSANNIAESLVRWVFGDFESYKTAAEKWLAENGLAGTTIGTDASGFDAGTVSTPSDMVKIGQLALQNSALREIVSQQSAVFPEVGVENNTNKLLPDGFIGIKTGNSDPALSCLLFAREYGDDVVIGVLMGQPFNSTFDSARKIWASLERNFTNVTIPAGTVVGKYILPWGGEVGVATSEEVSARTWRDAQPKIELFPLGLNTNHKTQVGEIALDNKTSTLRINSVVTQPSLFWRLGNLDKLKW